MDTQGNIEKFESDEAAKAAGFTIQLTPEQSEMLMEHKKEHRLSELMWANFRDEVLGGREPDTMTKVRYKTAIKYTCDFLTKLDE